MKRRRNASGQFTGGSVTGGTGDVKPQLMTVFIPRGASTSDYSTVEVPVPRIIMSTAGTATIMEILKLYWYISVSDLADSDQVSAGFLSYRSLRTTNDATTLARYMEDTFNPSSFGNVIQSSVETTTGASVQSFPQTVDLTDSNGNGILVAVDRFFATQGQFSNTVTSDAAVKILYRMVNVGITEYVGIVQSQAVG